VVAMHAQPHSVDSHMHPTDHAVFCTCTHSGLTHNILHYDL